MLDEDKIIEYLKENLKEPRFIHSIGVMNMAVKLAQIHSVDVINAKFAGLLHDIAKNMSNAALVDYCRNNGIDLDPIKLESPGMLHAEVGADIAKKKFGANLEIVQAIQFHTLASENMNDLDKIIYIADLIEEGRDLPGLEPIRETAYKDLDKALVLSLEYCIENVKERGKRTHPQSENALIMAKKRVEYKLDNL